MNTPSKQDPNKQAKIIDKLVNDLEDLTKKLNDLQQINQVDSNYLIRDDCLELQKFCAKLEYLIQFNLRDKKGGLNDNKEYWTFILDVLKSSRSFEDAVKYVKNINEIKTNLGRARAFIRFCLQYHRLADAIQQLTMEDKILSAWYKDNSVWSNEMNKSRIIQLLYDLNDVNFELVSRNNFELDTTWPTINLNTPNKNNFANQNRLRSFSITSYSSINIDKDQTDTNSVLLSSTPLEMDDDLIYSNLNKQNSSDTQQNEPTMGQSIYYDTANSNMPIEQYEKKIEDLMTQLSFKDSQLNELKQNLSETAVSTSPSSDPQLVENLNEQLKEKIKQISELNTCLIKQTNLSENLSEMLKQSNLKITELNNTVEKNLLTISNLETDNNALKFELSSKAIEEERLKQEFLTQSQSIQNLKEMSYQQEKEMSKLKIELNSAIQERSTEVDAQQSEYQRNRITLQLKEEEIYLLNDQIQKLTKTLNQERECNQSLTNELNELKLFYQNLNEKNNSYIQQLEADNVEIKKRIVKLIKEKAELWQKADNLEYENLLKTNSMWLDDSNVSSCMNCNSQFGLLLRKHHCRICLKIYCYYCCNNWIEYNNNKLRVCKKCCATRDNVNRLKGILCDDKSISTPETSETHDENAHDHNEIDDDDNADVNFEVRAEKLAKAEHSDDGCSSIYDQNSKLSPIDESLKHIVSSPPKEIGFKLHDDGDDEEDEVGFKQKEDEKLSVSSSSKFLSKIAHKFEFKYFTSSKQSSSQGEQNENDEDLVIRKKKIKKKNKSSQSLSSVNNNTIPDDLDTFAIVSQEEIDKIKS
ncbi:unnamed protein product [Brachionus calyciflorus]|uniref:Uncharacterized protein n=1 Tax=Brachionus calyciflorus TaxID=104777 RepID=A0A813PXE7_9BILA|nr:unnamed protein product [Brachionus calyciflorus]